MANKKQLYPETIGSVVMVTDPTVASPTTNGTALNTVLQNLKENGGDGKKYAGKSEYALGGLKKDTNLDGKSATEVLEMILKPEYAPRWTDYSGSVDLKISEESVASNSVREVGTSAPSTSNYSVSATAASAVGGDNTATGGSITKGSVMKDNSHSTVTGGASNNATGATFGAQIKSAGDFAVSAQVTFAEGSTQVKTNKGNLTNKTASDSTTLLDEAEVNKYINDVYHIARRNIAYSHKLQYVYPIFATTATAGTLTKQALTTEKNRVKFVAKAGIAKFAIPKVYTLSKIEEWSALNEYLPITDGWTKLEQKLTIGDNYSVDYCVYTRNNPYDNDNTFYITFE